MKCPMASAFWWGWRDAFWHLAWMGSAAFETDGEATRIADCCTCIRAKQKSSCPHHGLAVRPSWLVCFNGCSCGMSLVVQALCCSTLSTSCRWSRSLLPLPKAKPLLLCCQLRLHHTWWATFLVSLSNPCPLWAAGQWCHSWRPPQGNTGGSWDCTRSYCGNSQERLSYQYFTRSRQKSILDLLWRRTTLGREWRHLSKALGNSWPELSVDLEPMLYPPNHYLLNHLDCGGANTIFFPTGCFLVLILF